MLTTGKQVGFQSPSKLLWSSSWIAQTVSTVQYYILFQTVTIQIILRPSNCYLLSKAGYVCSRFWRLILDYWRLMIVWCFTVLRSQFKYYLDFSIDLNRFDGSQTVIIIHLLSDVGLKCVWQPGSDRLLITYYCHVYF